MRGRTISKENNPTAPASNNRFGSRRHPTRNCAVALAGIGFHRLSNVIHLKCNAFERRRGGRWPFDVQAGDAEKIAARGYWSQ